MGRSHDRISNMPDPILQTILSMMPLKSAIRTSVLSTRWRSLWEHNLLTSTNLNFTEDFSNSQSPKEFVLNLNRYLLQLQHTKNLEKFTVYFSPFHDFFPDIQRWISFAISKGVKELDLDLSQGFTDPCYGGFNDGRGCFTLPDCLLECKSLTHLSLSRCDLCSSDPISFTNWSQLRSLSLKYVNILEVHLESLLSNCKLLESLSLIDCLHGESSISVVVAPEQRLSKLTLVDTQRVFEVEIFAPNLQSFHYYGQFCLMEHTINVPSLVDAFICPLGCSQGGDQGFDNLLPDLSHVKVLTINTMILMDLAEEIRDQVFPIGFHNLQELQLLVDSMTDENLDGVFSFFGLCTCPFIERLFIQMRGKKEEDPIHANHAMKSLQRPQNVGFSHLRVIKMTNFKGWRNEIRLLKFLLEKALCLESLIILVAPLGENGIDLVSQDKKPSERRRLEILSGQVSMLPKASSQASIVLCESSEDDKRIQPVHANVYHEYKYSKDRFDLISSIRTGVDLQVLI